MIRILLFIAVMFEVLMCLGQIKWSAEKEVAMSTYGNNSPRIEIDNKGVASILWGGSGNVYFSQWKTGSFTDVRTLNPDGIKVAESFWMGPELAVKGDTIFAVYKQTPENDTNSHIYSVRSVNGGQSFEAPVRVDYIGSHLSRFPVISIDETGNPMVAFMKFGSGFGEPHWVVALSDDKGMSYEKDFELGPKSSPDAEACDCCPGSVNGNSGRIAVTYRNNDENIRDIWTGFGLRNDRGEDQSMNLDENDWLILSCPASAPASVMSNDSLYTVFMNGASGSKRVYFSRASLKSGAKKEARLLVSDLTGVGLQDFPRISFDGGSMAAVWRQLRNNKIELALAYRNDITTGHFKYLSSLAINNARNADIAILGDSIYVVWQDNASRNVKFRAGNVAEVASLVTQTPLEFQVYPNPTTRSWTMSGLKVGSTWSIKDELGAEMLSGMVDNTDVNIPSSHFAAGCYWITITTEHRVSTIKMIKL